MNKNSLFKAVRTIQLVMLILIPSVIFAPPIPPAPGGSTPITPIDSGILFLIIVGISYGVKLILNSKKNLI